MGSPFIFNGSYAKSLVNALRLGTLAADPSGPQAGDMYFNSVSGTIKFYNGSSWSSLPSSSSMALRYFGATATVTGSDSLATFSTQDYDTNSAYSSGTFTVPAGQGGYYNINARVLLAGTFSLNNASAISIYVNSVLKAERITYAFASMTAVLVGIAEVLNLSAADTVQIKVRSAAVSPTVSASNTENTFTAIRVAASPATVISAWQTYTPTFTNFGTCTNILSKWRQVGQSYEIVSTFQAGTPAAGTAAVSLPGGASTSATLLPTNPAGASTAEVVGRFIRSVTTDQVDMTVLAAPSSTTLNFGYVLLSAGAPGMSITNGNLLCGAGEVVTFTASVPINGL